MLSGCQSAAKHEDPVKQAKSADFHYQLGLDALGKNNMPKAFDELFMAQQMAPERADILDAIGIAWWKRGDLDTAEKYYEKALQHSPAAATYYNYGGLLLQKGLSERAEAFFRRALEDPRYRNPYLANIGLGDALQAQDRFDEAIDAYRQARVMNPRQELSRLKEAQAYERTNRDNYAKAIYEAILRERPGNRPAMQGLLALLKKNGHVDNARIRLKKFSKHARNPEDTAWGEDELQKLSGHD